MKKIIVIILFLFPWIAKAVTLSEYNEALVNVAMDMATNYHDDFVYTYYWDGSPSNPIDRSELLGEWLNNGFNGIKTAKGYIYGTMPSKAGIQGSFENKYPVYCETFVKLAVYHTSGGMVSYSKDYEEIRVKDLQKGDLIHFPNHIAIYVDDASDNSSDTWRVIEASKEVKEGVINNTPDKGYRLKQEALSKLLYNTITSSYDFYDRLDDFAPIILSASQDGNSDIIKVSAKDEKHYDHINQSDILEPENHGIVAYTITQNMGVPEFGWISVNKVDYLSQDIQVKDNGTWNVWVKDVGGNVASMQVVVQNLVHKENDFPQIMIKSSLNDYEKEYDLVIELKDLDGLKEYCIGKTIEENCTKLNEEKSYDLHYTIKENGTYYIYVRDIYENDYQETLDIQTIDNQDPIIQKLYYQDGYIYVDAHDYQSGIKSYKLDDNEWQEDNRFMVKDNGNYIIMVQDMAGNYAKGEIKVGNRSFLIGDDIELLMQIIIVIGVLILLFLIIKMQMTKNKQQRH